MNKQEEKELISVIRLKYNLSGDCYIPDSEVIGLVGNMVRECGVSTSYNWECEKKNAPYGSTRYWAIKKLEQMERELAERNKF
jgi:hypothetical protein